MASCTSSCHPVIRSSNQIHLSERHFPAFPDSCSLSFWLLQWQYSHIRCTVDTNLEACPLISCCHHERFQLKIHPCAHSAICFAKRKRFKEVEKIVLNQHLLDFVEVMTGNCWAGGRKQPSDEDVDGGGRGHQPLLHHHKPHTYTSLAQVYYIQNLSISNFLNESWISNRFNPYCLGTLIFPFTVG